MNGGRLKDEDDLIKRTKGFALRIITMYSALPKTEEARVLGKQVLGSGISVGANYREACEHRNEAGEFPTGRMWHIGDPFYSKRELHRIIFLFPFAGLAMPARAGFPNGLKMRTAADATFGMSLPHMP